MAEWIRPHSISPGSAIGLAAPAGPVDRDRLDAGEAALAERGFQVVRGEDITARDGYLAGDDDRRAREFMDLVRDPTVDAILCVRGGYGCQRIVPRLDADEVRRAAKPLVGYSDVTTLLLWQARSVGLGGIHGPMLERGGGLDSVAWDALCQALYGDDEGRVLTGRGEIAGVAEGRLCGGSLSMVVASLGTPWEVDTRGAILLLEDVQEAPYRIDRMLHQLEAAGKLSGSARGVGVGALTGCGNPDSDDPSAGDVVREVLGSVGLPMVSDLPFGHIAENHSWPYGGRARLDGNSGKVTLLEASTASLEGTR